jgi:prolyl oligopeptidase
MADRLALSTLLALLVFAPAPLQAQQLEYPETRRVEHVDDYHGTMVADPYRWLEDVDSELRERLTELWDYERYGTPWKEAGYYVFTKNDGLQNQSVYYMQASLDAEPEVLLDPNTLSEDGTVSAGPADFTEDGKLMVYSVRRSGSDWREFFVRDVEAKRDLDDHIEWVKFSGASFTHDGKGFFYGRYPEPREGETYEQANRNQQLYYHRVGTAQSEDQLIYERPDQPEWSFGAFVTDDGRYAIMSVGHGTDERNRVYYKDLGDPSSPQLDAEVVTLLDDFDASYGFIDNDGPVFYFDTNLDAPKNRVIAIDIREPARENWREIVPEKDDVLQSVGIVNNQFVARYLHDAHTQILIYDMDGGFDREVELPTIGSAGGFSGEREDTEAFYSFSSYLYPSTIFRYDFESGESTVFRAPDVDFDPSAYETKQVFYESKDGTKIPMFITHKKGIALDGSNPTYLYAYGGFNISQAPRFSITMPVWYEMGGVYAVANLRGGGEYGEEWHKAGTKEQKQNVFDDFIAAAEYLIDEGYTSTPKLAIAGGSNGGLLVGAVMTQRPHLFGAALPAVGVMDMLRFHKFTIGWAWTSDYGSSDEPDGFRYLYSYSPYHNLHPDYYPATMVTTADHDDRVVPGHSFKFAARLQVMQMGDAPALIRIQTKAGHGGGKPTAMIIQEYADRWAFLVENLGIVMQPAATHDDR